MDMRQSIHDSHFLICSYKNFEINCWFWLVQKCWWWNCAKVVIGSRTKSVSMPVIFRTYYTEYGTSCFSRGLYEAEVVYLPFLQTNCSTLCDWIVPKSVSIYVCYFQDILYKIQCKHYVNFLTCFLEQDCVKQKSSSCLSVISTDILYDTLPG